MKKILITFITFVLSACSSTYNISSKPNDVSIFDGNNLLGNTPLVVNTNDIANVTSGGSLLRVSKKGYKSFWLWLPRGSFNYEIAINLNPFFLSTMSEESDLTGYEADRLDLYRISDLLLKLQTDLLLQKEVDEKVLKILLETNPTLGSAHFLYSLFLIKQNKISESLIYLKDAIRYSPEENDFLELYNEMLAKNESNNG